MNANELYSWNVPFYDEGELPRSGLLKEKTRLFEQIPPHKDELLAGAVERNNIIQFLVESAALDAEVDVRGENDEEIERLKLGLNRDQSVAQGEDDIDENENKDDNKNNKQEDDQLIQGRQKKNSRIKRRDFVAEATQAAIELEAS